MKGTIYAIITLAAFSSGSLMASTFDFCTKGLPTDAAKELSQGKTDGKVATFGRCYSKAVAEKDAGKKQSDPNFVAAARSLLKSPEGAALAAQVGYKKTGRR